MNPSSVDELLKKYRKKPLFSYESLSFKFNYEKTDICRIIPQREPILYIDKLLGLELSKGLIAGQRHIPKDDPVFRGHFPDFPVYPGTYTIEMIGQLGLCLYYFCQHNISYIEPSAKPVALRATRVLGAVFMEPILPAKNVLLLAQKLEYDGFLATAIGQALIDDKVACVSIGEVAFI